MADKAVFIQALADILVGNKVMSRDRAKDLQKAFGDSSVSEFEDFLLEEGMVPREDILEALSVYYKVPSFDVMDQFFETSLLRDFPKEFLRRNLIIPLNVENHTMLNVIAAQPGREGLESAIRGFVSYDVVYMVGIPSDILIAIDEYYDKAVTEVVQDVDRHEEEREASEAHQAMLGEDEE